MTEQQTYTDDDLRALRELRDHLFVSPATESERGEADTDEPTGLQRTASREGNNPSPLRGDDTARFAAHLFGDDDTVDGHEPEPPPSWTPRVLDTY